MSVERWSATRTLVRSVGGNFLALLVGEGLSRALAFGVSLVLARRLGVDRFGVVELALAVLAYVQLGIEAGLDTVATRAVARRPDLRAIYAGNVVGMRLVFALVAWLAVASAGWLAGLSGLTRVLLMAFSTAVIPSAFALGWSFQAGARMRPVAVAGVVTQATYLALIVWLVPDASAVRLVPLALGVATAAGAGVLAWWHGRQFGVVRPRVDLAFWRQSLGEAMPILGSRVLRAISFNFDVLFLGWVSTSAAVAYYASAYRFVLIPVLGYATFFSALFPVLARVSPVERQRMVRLLLVAIGATGVLAAVVLNVLAVPLLTVAMGADYAPAAAPLRWLAWSIPFVGVAGLFRQVLLVRHLQRLDLLAVGLGAAINVALVVTLVPRAGVTGAAIATIVGEVAVLAATALGLRVGDRSRPQPEEQSAAVASTLLDAGLSAVRSTGGGA